MNEIPKAIVLWSTEGDHAGFMLVSYEAGNSHGNCVFMLSPASVEGIDSAMGIIVSELKVDGEQNFNVVSNSQGHTLSIRPQSFPEILFRLNSNFEGDVFTEFEGETKRVGSAVPAKKDA